MPIAGRVATRTGTPRYVSARIDRLHFGVDRLMQVDYETGFRPPARVDETHATHVARLAVYRALPREAFPGRAVAYALVWTTGPAVHPVPDALLDAHMPSRRRDRMAT